MISIYSIINNDNKQLLSNNILDKFKSITNDVVFATNIKLNTEEKNSIKKHKCKLIETSNTNNINLFNTALNETEGPIKLCLDLDEYIPIDQKNIWYDLANILSYDKADSYVIPVFNDQLNYITSKSLIHKNNCEIGCLANRENCFDLINKQSKTPASCKILPIDILTIKEYAYPFIIKINHV